MRTLSLLVISLLAVAITCLAQNPSVTQSGGSGSGTGNQVVTFGSNEIIHHTLVACSGGAATATLTLTSDNQTNTWTNALTRTDGGSNGQIRCDTAADIKAGAVGNNVTCNISASDGHCVVFELANVALVAPVDQVNTNHGSGTAPTVTSGATTLAVEIVIGFCFDWFHNNTYTKNASYTLGPETHNAGGGDSSSSEFLVVTVTGAQTPTYTLGTSSADWIMAVLTLKGANQPGAGGCTSSRVSLMGVGSCGAMLLPRVVQWASVDVKNGQIIRKEWHETPSL